MWGQEWDNTYDLVVPYPDEPKIDLTKNLIKKGYKPIDLFKVKYIFLKNIFK